MNKQLNFSRRHALASSLALCLSALLPSYAFAQADSATRPLRLVVPFPAGGTADVLPRILAEKMRDAFPAGIVIENRTGAGGNVGGEFVARAEPDGNTLLASPPGPVAINHNLYKTMSFDPTKWVPITVIATGPGGEASKVLPSGSARATNSPPTLPPAPVRFSITMPAGKASRILSARMRGRTSAVPPAGNGTTKRKGLVALSAWAKA